MNSEARSSAGLRKVNFPPVVDGRTRLLILGSLPGDASLKAGQYYGHPRNAFWRLIGGVIGCDLAALRYDGYEQRPLSTTDYQHNPVASPLPPRNRGGRLSPIENRVDTRRRGVHIRMLATEEPEKLIEPA